MKSYLTRRERSTTLKLPASLRKPPHSSGIVVLKFRRRGGGPELTWPALKRFLFFGWSVGFIGALLTHFFIPF